MTCQDIVLKILQSDIQHLSEFPFLLFQGIDCQYDMYPKPGDFPEWDTTLSQIPLDQIGSVYIPPHALLELRSRSGLVASIKGPATISNMEAYMIFWEATNYAECDDTSNPDCHKKVRFGLTESDPILNLCVSRRMTWDQYLHNLASRNQQLMIAEYPVTVDFDRFFDRICANPKPGYHCECFDAHQQLLTDFPGISDQLYVNNLPNGCDPTKHYMPTQAKIGTQSKEECLTMLKSMIRTGKFKTLDDGGDKMFSCGGTSFQNTNRSGLSRNAMFDDIEEQLIESSEMSSNETYFILVYVLIGILLFTFIVLIFYSFEQLHARRIIHGPSFRDKVMMKS